MKIVKQIWPRITDLASASGLPYVKVQSWYVRDHLPPDNFGDVIAAAFAAGHTVTVDQLYAEHREWLAERHAAKVAP